MVAMRFEARLRQGDSAMATTGMGYPIDRKLLEPLTVAAVHMMAPYDHCGVGFSQIGRALGRHLHGDPFCLHHNPPKPDGTGDYDTCIPIVGEVTPSGGIVIKSLAGGPCVYTTHFGPYDGIGQAYEALNAYLDSHGLHLSGAPREVYLKGPRMFIPRSPKHFVTEVQFPVAS
jgi:effector-binding domain-containing protein